jgi:hypothetical protein
MEEGGAAGVAGSQGPGAGKGGGPCSEGATMIPLVHDRGEICRSHLCMDSCAEVIVQKHIRALGEARQKAGWQVDASGAYGV